MLQKRWDIPAKIPTDVDNALSAYKPILRQLLCNRELTTEQAAKSFLSAEVEFETNPLQLSGMSTAVERIRQAIARGKTIAVYGDYDVDGVTATALLVEALQWLGATVKPYIPHRFEEGYGLNREALDNLKADGASVVVTVDCGISSCREVEIAKEQGLTVIITDHHQLPPVLPQADAILNPLQNGCCFPFKNLAGVGVAFYLMAGLRIEMRKIILIMADRL